MPRDLPVGNGALLVNFDRNYQIRDIYWPRVGKENHTEGHPFRFGAWTEGKFSWIADAEWQRDLRYGDETLVTRVLLKHAGLGLSLVCQDAVDFHENLYLRRIDVRNEVPRPREVRLFFSHDFHIGGTGLGDSAYYESDRLAVFHYKDRRWFLVNAATLRPDGWHVGLDQWAVGVKEVGSKEGSWRDAEDGRLSGNAVAQGSVDSTVAVHLTVPAAGEGSAFYWIAVGDDFKEVTRINRAVREKGPTTYLERTRHYWSLWARKETLGDAGPAQASCARAKLSLLILRTQIDNGGAIVAATDYDISHYGRDTYAYMWPRDGAIVAAALVDAGYSEPARRFFEFCHRAVTEEGYLLHKYNPDGSLSSSWLGWYRDGRKEIPVQEDETALVIWALWRYFLRFRDVEFVRPLFRGLIVRSVNWLAAYRDGRDGLPLPSWDLWEERRGVLAWTVGAVWAGLDAGSRFAAAFGESALAATYRRAADEVRAGALERLWSDPLGRYARMVDRTPGGWDQDATLDASMAGLWRFGMLPPDDPRVTATMTAIRDRLWVKTPAGGLARYENDPYQRVQADPAVVPGNPWFISTLWLGQWYAAVARNAAELKPAEEIAEWALAHALPSGVMAEQVHPFTNEPLSVSPLTWSHAEFVTLLYAIENRRRACPAS